MKDIVYQKKQNRTEWNSSLESNFVDVETLSKYKNDPDAVYQVVTKYDTKDGYDVSIVTTRNLDTALEILKNECIKEISAYCERADISEDEIKKTGDFHGSDYKILKDTYALLDLCADEYITIYITVNIIK